MRAASIVGATGTVGAVGITRHSGPSVELLDLIYSRPAWMRDAACREHPELSWFPGSGVDLRPIKSVCAGCLVRDECRSFADAEQLRYGVFGGASEGERRAGRSRSRRDAAAATDPDEESATAARPATEPDG